MISRWVLSSQWVSNRQPSVTVKSITSFLLSWFVLPKIEIQKNAWYSLTIYSTLAIPIDSSAPDYNHDCIHDIMICTATGTAVLGTVLHIIKDKQVNVSLWANVLYFFTSTVIKFWVRLQNTQQELLSNKETICSSILRPLLRQLSTKL